MVLNDPPLPPGDPSGGPCYRCVFPKPPPPESVVSCGDGGILGPVVGTMGVLQALEAIKVLTRVREGNIQKADGKAQEKQAGHSLLIFSAYASPQFRTIRLRPTRKPKCAGCSAQASVTAEALTSGSMDYVQFCGAVSPVDALSASERMSASNYAKFRNSVGGHPNPNAAGGGRGMNRPSSDTHILVDVREKVQFELCNLEGSINIPFSTVTRMPAPSSPSAEKSDMEGVEPEWIAQLKTQARNEKPIFVVCRLGNDSQVAVRKMKAFGLDNGGKRWVGDIKGGLRAWRESVDEEFPEY